jgi:hypothetical protein
LRIKGEADLELSGAWAGSHKGIRAQVTLDVGGDDFSGDILTLNEPLVCSRHGESKRCEEERGRKAGSDVRGGGAKKYELRRQGGAQGSKITLVQGPKESSPVECVWAAMFSGGRGEELFQKQKQERAGAEANTQMRG